eukprot:scaffold3076_cov117-Isochrysis_galbana.AAC.5
MVGIACVEVELKKANSRLSRAAEPRSSAANGFRKPGSRAMILGDSSGCCSAAIAKAAGRVQLGLARK